MAPLKDELEALTQEVSELTTTVREHAENRSDIDIESLGSQLMDLSDSMTELRAAEEKRLRETVTREGDPIGPDADPQVALAAFHTGDLALAKELRNRPTFQGRVRHGKFAGYKYDDLRFVHNFLVAAKNIYRDGVKAGPSDELTKLLEATGSGAGDELVPTGMAAELWADIFLESKVAANLGVVPMPTDPFDSPAGWGSITWRKGGVGEATDAQNPATAKSTMTSTEAIAEVQFNYNLEEDAIIAVLPSLRAELTRSGRENMDAFCLNADATASSTGNVNLDDGTPPTDSYYLSNGQDGIRHYYLVDATGQSTDVSTTLTDALWRAGVARMGKYAASPADVLAITNVKTYLISLMGLTNVRTIDKYGPMATILNGELAKMDGIPIIVSESMPLAEDDGKVSATAASNDEGQIALVHKGMWQIGFRRQLLIEVDRDIQKRVYIMVVSFRIAIATQDHGDSSSRAKGHTAGIHGITYA